jgi:2'-5' RNA ligase
VSRARLFVAAWPPETIVEALAGLDRPTHDGLRWTPREQWHVTLRFLGSTEIEPVLDALAGVRLPSTVAHLGPELVRLGRGVLVAPVEGVDELAAAVIDATADLGRPPEARPFSAHLTLARSRGRARVPAALAGQPVAARWPVDEITLVASHLHPKGARYEILRRLPSG